MSISDTTIANNFCQKLLNIHFVKVFISKPSYYNFVIMLCYQCFYEGALL
jgi:hypothetical protein